MKKYIQRKWDKEQTQEGKPKTENENTDDRHWRKKKRDGRELKEVMEWRSSERGQAVNFRVGISEAAEPPGSAGHAGFCQTK